MVTIVIVFAVVLLVPVGKKSKRNQEPIDSVHQPVPPRIPAPLELEEAYELAIPGHARIRCPAPQGAEDGTGLRAKSTGRYEGSLRWIEIRAGHLNAATTDSSGEVMVYAGTVPLGITRWSEPNPGAWTHCSMVEVEYVKRDGLVVSRDRGIPVGGVTVNVCGSDVTADDNGRFTMSIPRYSSCDVRTHKIEGDTLYLGPKRTVTSESSPDAKPIKVREYGKMDQVSLAQLQGLVQERLARAQETPPTAEHNPIAAALEFEETRPATKVILQDWLQAERDRKPTNQLKALARSESTLADYRAAFWHGALADL